MKKQLRQVTGTSVGITFTKEERDAKKMGVGDFITIPDDFEVHKEAEDNLRNCIARQDNARRAKELKKRMKLN